LTCVREDRKLLLTNARIPMTQTPDRLSRFWKELQRRKVLRSLAIYAGTAFVVLEAATIIFPRWGFPDWTIDLLLWLLILGAFINVIIAWIYDITPGGMQRTKPLEEVSAKEKISDSRGWKAATYSSLVVIIALLLFNIFSSTKVLKAGDIQSLVILPFENFTGDDQLENMVAGMHSLLIGDMGRISGLRVIGGTSSKLYKGAGKSAAEIASELHVDAVVEGSVMCLGDSVCMQFRLINTKGEEEQLWVGEYNEDKGQILNLYNRVTKLIAKEVHIELTASEEQILTQDRAADRDVIDDYIRSQAYWEDLSREALDDSYKFLIQARDKDPEWATLYAALAIVWAGRMQMGMVDTQTGRSQISKNIERARNLDPAFTDAHFINGVIFIWPDWEWEKGEKSLVQALAVNPNHVMARMYYAHLLMSLQRMDEALAQGKLALELDPKNPLVLSLYAVLLKGAGQYEAALEQLEQALTIDPNHSFTRGQMGRAYYNLGQYERDLALQRESLSQVLGEEHVNDLLDIYREHGRLAAYQEVLLLWEEAGKQHDFHPIFMARNYYRAGRFSEAIDELEKGFEIHDPNMPYIGTGTRFVHLHDSTRFLAILDRMNLPHPKTP